MKTIQRKLQGIAGSIFVSLPRSWVNQYKLKKGAELDITFQEDGTLRLGPVFEKGQEVKRRTIIYDAIFPRRFFRDYLANADFITVNFSSNNPKGKQDVRRFIKKLMNVEIIEEKPDCIVLQVFKITEISMHNALKRMSFLTQDMFETLLSKNKGDLSELDSTISRFYYIFIQESRNFLEEGRFVRGEEHDLVKIMDLRMAAEKIERVGDLLKELEGVKELYEKELLGFAIKVKDMYDKALKAMFSKNFEKAVTLWFDRKNILKDLQRLKTRFYKKKECKCIECANNLFQIFEYAKDIANLVR